MHGFLYIKNDLFYLVFKVSEKLQTFVKIVIVKNMSDHENLIHYNTVSSDY